MRIVRWARLHVPADCGLRLGAWYPVTALTVREAHVQVRGQGVTVARSLLEFRTTPPREWTVVHGPLHAARVPASARDGYLVCPNCRYRNAIPEARVPTTRCPRCNELFAVAWDDLGPQTASPPWERRPAQSVVSHRVPPSLRETLRQDARMTRRRSSTDRRRSLERRSVERRAAAVVPGPRERRLAERRQGSHHRSGRDRRTGIERRRPVPW